MRSSNRFAAFAGDMGDAEEEEEETCAPPQPMSDPMKIRLDNFHEYPELKPIGINLDASPRNRVASSRRSCPQNHKNRKSARGRAERSEVEVNINLSSNAELMSIEREAYKEGEAIPANNKDVELAAMDDTKSRRQSHKLVMTVESGAGESVCGPNVSPNYDIYPSDEQRRGTYYMAVGGARLPNMGEKHIHLQATDGKKCRVRMQVTQVRRPLLSVARMCDENNRVVFESSGGYVEHLVSGDRVYANRNGNVYNPEVETLPNLGLARPGAK